MARSQSTKSPKPPPEPEIVELPARKMATVRTIGDPSVALSKVMPALYGAVYTLKFDLKKKGVTMKVGALCGRWPKPLDTPGGVARHLGPASPR